jgi:hypothetical protein
LKNQPQAQNHSANERRHSARGEEALALSAHGIELADALRLTSTPAGATFVSFDQALVHRAKRAGILAIFDSPS